MDDPFDTPDISTRQFPAIRSQADIAGTAWGGEIKLGSSQEDAAEEAVEYSYDNHTQS